MATEDYVSFETAKLLEEKGFDWMESPFYSEQDRDEWKCHNVYTVPNPLYNPDLPFDSETIALRAPHVSLQLAMKWLRKAHNLFIELTTGENDGKSWYDFDVIPVNGKNIEWDYYENIPTEEYSSPEHACEAAIKYCLENLI